MGVNGGNPWGRGIALGRKLAFQVIGAAERPTCACPSSGWSGASPRIDRSGKA